MSLSVKGEPYQNLHLIGVLGAGMSALAQFLTQEGCKISGSDRHIRSHDTQELRDRLTQTGCRLCNQNGSGIEEQVQAVVVSTAIEEDNPDIAAARKRGLPVLHRSVVLAAIVASRKTIAICGTSGKSTVTGMVFEFLRSCGQDPSLITGANLECLRDQNLVGNAFRGASNLLVIEADESDGSLVKYKPFLSLFLNISKDHKPVVETMANFKRIAGQSKVVIKNADDLGLKPLKAAITFGVSEESQCKPQKILQTSPSVKFVLDSQLYELSLPGTYNLSNVLAALCVCFHLGCNKDCLAKGVQEFKGVSRRFQQLRAANGAAVIDDFAHNPEKIRAVVTAARDFGNRVFAVFQPHGFGPTRFLKNELVEAFTACLRDQDEVYILPIYYAGGTVKKDIASNDLVKAIQAKSRNAFAPSDRSEFLNQLRRKVRQKDVVIVMGARDPSLSGFVREIAEKLGT